MRKSFGIGMMALMAAVVLLSGCATSRSGGGVLPTDDPLKDGKELTIRFRKMGSNEWEYPLAGAKVICPFGGKRPNHKGTDLKTKAKDKIRAAFAGVVTYSGEMSGYGNVVFISHKSGLETRYAHNVKNLVKKGEKVKTGEVIALEGRTGNATTEHLHFETRVGGVAFDSEEIFDHKKHELRKVVLRARREKNGGVTVEVKKK